MKKLIDKQMDTCTKIEELRLKFEERSKPAGAIKTLSLSDGQQKIISAIDDNRYTVVKKTRVTGATTAALAYLIANAVMPENKGKRFCFINGSLDSLRLALINACIMTKESFPAETATTVQINLHDAGSRAITFPNGSIIYFSLPKFCTERFDTIIVDECACYDFDVKLITSQLAEDGKACFISTPHGILGTFVNLWTKPESEIKHVSVSFADTPWQGKAFAERMEKEFGGITDEYVREIYGGFC